MDAFGEASPEVPRTAGEAGARGRSLRRWILIVACGAAAGAFAACLRCVYAGVADVARSDGGFCASGGPYAIAHQCSAADVRLLLIGIGGMLVSGAVFAGFSAWARGPVAIPGLSMWSALFGALGYRFLDIGAHSGAAAGLIVTGAVFVAMAAGGLVPIAGAALGWLRHGGEPDALPAVPIVYASVRAPERPAPPAPGAAASFAPTRIVIPPTERSS